MRLCDDVQRRLLDGAVLDDARRRHLRGCAACRDFERAHGAARALQGAVLPRGPRFDRRRVVRRLGTIAAAAVVVTAALLWRAARARPAPEFTEADVVWTVLWAAHDARLDDAPRPDPALAAFGPVVRWAAPPPGDAHPIVVWTASKEE